MTLKARYEPETDRIRVIFQPEGADIQVYSAMRRQWLWLLYRIRLAAKQMGVELATPEVPKPPRGRPARDPATDNMSAVLLDGFRIRVEGDNVRLMLVTDQKARGFSMRAPGLRRLEEMVWTQAERAGWDPQAGLQRLQATAAAKATLDKLGK